jgi:hypothetical protein
MKKVFLHIGHGKTGTSATQTALARLHPQLRPRGLCYPAHPSFDGAAKGQISSGNVDGFQSDWFAAQVLGAIRDTPDSDSFIFSNEHLFWVMDAFFDAVPQIRDHLVFHVLLSVRDPTDMLSSAYMQAVKRGGYTGTLEEFAQSEGHILHAAQLIARMQALGVNFTVLNYSHLRHDITARILEVVGAADLFDATARAQLGTVNRSLSRAELQAVILVNQIFGASCGARVSDALVQMLPDVATDMVFLEDHSLQPFLDRVRAAVDLVNAHLPPVEKIMLSRSAPRAATTVQSLSAEQIKIIQSALDIKPLSEDDAPMLYGAAVTHETGQVLSKSQAVMLLRLAARAKPQGPMIRQKLAELSDEP